MMDNKKNTMTKIPCKRSTRGKLRKIGNKQETYDQILNRLIDIYKEDRGLEGV